MKTAKPRHGTLHVGERVDPLDPNATRMVLESRAYDPAGQLASVVDAMGRETAYTYHNDGLLESKKRVRRDAQGEITSSTLLAQYEYDHGGQLIRVVGPDGTVRDYDYDDAGLRNRETLDANGMTRATIRTFASDGAVATERTSNGFTFVAGRSAEQPHLLSAGGSKIDGAGSRYVDGTASMTYRLALPADASTGSINIEIDNQYLIEFSSDNENWTEVARETRNIQDGSNRIQLIRGINAYLQQSKTFYVRISDSQPSNGWGGALSRMALEYNRAGERTAKTSNGYDVNGNLTSITVDNAGGTPTALVSRAYRDARGLVTQEMDATGAATDHTYDAAGHLRTTTGPARTVWRNGVRTDDVRPVTTMGRNTFGEVTHQRDANGATTTIEYDEMGRTTAVTRPPYTTPGGVAITSVSRTTYDFDGQPATVTDPLGRQTSYTRDKYGRIISVTQPKPADDDTNSGPKWQYSYDRVGENLETIDPTGARTLATYNDLGYQITETAAERVGDGVIYHTTALGRNDAGLVTSQTTPLGNTSTIDYNRAGEPTTITDPNGLLVNVRYDAQGRVLRETVAGTRATSHTYDAAGREVSQADHTVTDGVLSAPLRQRVTSYDALGRPTTYTSAQGRTTQYTYDAGGNLTSVTQHADDNHPITVTLGYDPQGLQTRTVDANGNATDYTYNDWGLPTTVREPDTGDSGERTWTTTYDAAGQAVGEQLPGGVSRTRHYDGLGRMVEETGAGAAGPTVPRLFGYDEVGRTTKVSNANGDVTYTYNDRGLLTRSSGTGTDNVFGYDQDGNLVTRTDPAGTGTFSYDPGGRLKTVTDALTQQVATYSYQPTGETHGINYGSGKPARQFDYDNFGRLITDTVTTADGTVALRSGYDYDRDDLLTARETTGYIGGGHQGYGYDGLGRLTSWTRPDGEAVGYGYDDASNRTTVTGPAGTRTYTYDARNRLRTATGGGEPDLINTWSERGTLESTTTATTTTTYTNNAFDRPVAVSAPGISVDYTYDALDRLVRRGDSALYYTDLTNNPTRVPTGNGDATVFRDPAGAVLSDKHGTDPGRLQLTDQVHGDAIAAVDNLTGSVLATRSYDPNGNITASSGQFSAGFQGGWTDPATGQVNAHARWYDPAQASFTSRDSIDLVPDPVQQINKYAYANANPRAVACSGRWPLSWGVVG